MLKKISLKILVALSALLVAATSYSQVLTVTSPTNGSFLGLRNKVNFTITELNVQANVRAVATGPGGVTFSEDQDFTPNADQKVDGSLDLNFQQGSPEGEYTIVVTATRKDTNVQFGSVTISVTLDLTKPKLLEFNPIGNTFVRGGTVIISVKVRESQGSFKDYRVRIDGQDIPNNTGETLNYISGDVGTFAVEWQTAGIQFDGTKSINIRVRDQADNTEETTFNVTLDRIAPTVQIVQPSPTLRLNPRSTVPVAIDINDGTGSSVAVTGVDVIAYTMDGAFLGRVSRASFRNTGGGNFRWTGRLRWTNRLPREFKIVVNVTDRAGNAAPAQEVIVRYR